MHCVVLRGHSQSIVRRWANRTLLNGQPFQDSQLEIGDVIRVGGIEIEVVGDTRGNAESRDGGLSPMTPQSHSDMHQLVEQIDQTQQRLSALQDDLCSTQHEDSAALDLRLVQLEKRIERKVKVHHETEIGGLRDNIQRLQLALDKERTKHDQRVDEWVEEKTLLAVQLQSRLADYDRANTELDQLAGRLNQSENELDEAREKWASDIEMLRAERDQKLASLAEHNEGLSHQLAVRETDMDQLRNQLAGRDVELVSKVEELQRQRDDLDRQRLGWEKENEVRVTALQQRFDEEKLAWTDHRSDLERQISGLESKVAEIESLQATVTQSEIVQMEFESH